MTPAEHYAEAERWLSAATAIPGTEFVLVDHETYTHAQCAEIAQVHATLATVDRAVSRQAEVSEQAKRAMCTCAHIPDIPAAVTHVDPDCPIHGGT